MTSPAVAIKLQNNLGLEAREGGPRGRDPAPFALSLFPRITKCSYKHEP